MDDLIESSRLFEASSRLQSAASVLAGLAEGGAINNQDVSVLKWAAEFLRQVDWTAGDSDTRGVSGRLALQATTVRPVFYAALIGIQKRLLDAGIGNEAKVVAFLRKLYSFLEEGGNHGKKNGTLEPAHLALAATLLHEIATGILLQLTDNGLPRENEPLTV